VKIALTIPGKPQPKQRARKGRHGWYTPSKTREYENRVKQFGDFELMHWRATSDRPWPLDARYCLTVTLFMPDKRRRDADNCVKSICDGLNGVLWDDDAQVVELRVRKDYDKEEPRSEVVVEVLP